MKQLISSLKIFWFVLGLNGFVAMAQSPFMNEHRLQSHEKSYNSDDYFKGSYPQIAATATCPTNPVTIAGQDILGNTVNNGQTFVCNATPFYVYIPITSGEIASPCIETEFTNYHANMGTYGSETFYEGGVNIGCISNSSGCAFPIGGGSGIAGAPWGVQLSLLDPSQQHDFVFCRSGSITTSTITFIDCWTGAQLSSTPTSTVFSNANPPNTSTCFTMSVAAGTSIGTSSFSITPPSASIALTDFHDGEAYVNVDTLPSGTYTLHYSFTPPPSSGCGTVTGTFSFTIGPNITASVTSATVCSGASATLTASSTGGTGTTTYSWTPATGLTSTTGSSVTVITPTASTTYTVTAMNGGCIKTATATVTVNSAPTLTVNSPSICLGDSAILVADGATSYTWNPITALNINATGDTAKAGVTSTTIYTVTGSIGTCTSSATSTVTLIASPSITVNSATICVGDSAVLAASGANTYTWAPLTSLLLNPTNDTAKSGVTSTTIYTVTGTVGSCIATPATATVTVNSLPTISVNSATICLGDSATLTASGASTYAWIPTTLLSTTTGSMVVSQAIVTTDYTVTGTDANGCKNSAIANVTVNLAPALTVTSATVCTGDSAQLAVTGASSYTWNPLSDLHLNVTGDTAHSGALTTQTYTVIGAIGNCIDSATVTATIIPAITLTITPVANPICSGMTDTLIASGADTYTWSTMENTDSIVVVPTTGTTSYTVNGTVGTCLAIPALVTVTVVPTPTLTVNNDTTVCSGSIVTLWTSGATNYVWVDNTGNPLTTTVVTPTVAQTYYVSGMNGACIATDSVKITINPLPTLITSSTPSVICLGDTAFLSANGADVYAWAPSSGLNGANTATPFATPNVNTTYTVVGTDVNGCSSTKVVTVSTSSVMAMFTADPETGDAPLNVNLTNTSMGATTYTWNYGTGTPQTTSSTATQTTTYSVAGNYTVILIVSNVNGCIDTDTTIIIVNESYAISIPNIFTPNGDGVNDTWFVKNTGVSSMSIFIYDRWGLKVWESNSAASMWDGGKEKDGTYFYIIKATDTKGTTNDYKGNITLLR